MQLNVESRVLKAASQTATLSARSLTAPHLLAVALLPSGTKRHRRRCWLLALRRAKGKLDAARGGACLLRCRCHLAKRELARGWLLYGLLLPKRKATARWRLVSQLLLLHRLLLTKAESVWRCGGRRLLPKCKPAGWSRCRRLRRRLLAKAEAAHCRGGGLLGAKTKAASGLLRLLLLQGDKGTCCLPKC